MVPFSRQRHFDSVFPVLRQQFVCCGVAVIVFGFWKKKEGKNIQFFWHRTDRKMTDRTNMVTAISVFSFQYQQSFSHFFLTAYPILGHAVHCRYRYIHLYLLATSEIPMSIQMPLVGSSWGSSLWSCMFHYICMRLLRLLHFPPKVLVSILNIYKYLYVQLHRTVTCVVEPCWDSATDYSSHVQKQMFSIDCIENE